MTTAIILSAGRGLRLRPLTELIPKCFIMVCGKPIVQWEIEHLEENGFDEIYVVVSKEYYEVLGGMRDYYGARILYQNEPRGTLSTLKFALRYIEKNGGKKCDYLLVQNGDVISDVNLKRCLRIFSEVCERDEKIICGVIATRLRLRYGVLGMVGDCKGYVLFFDEKPLLHYPVNMGYYFFTREIFNYIKKLPDEGDLERTLFPKLVKEGRVYGILGDESYWFAIDTFKDVIEASKCLMKLREREKRR